MNKIEFKEHLRQWHMDTMLQSNYYFYLNNDHFKAIVAEGESVVDWLYQAMVSDKIGHLHLFMRAIYGNEVATEVENAYTESVAPGWVGLKISEIRLAWMKWYESKNLSNVGQE